MCSVSDGEHHKCFLCHRFIWECYNDIIPKNYEIDHINKDKLDNRIENLRCVTINEKWEMSRSYKYFEICKDCTYIKEIY